MYSLVLIIIIIYNNKYRSTVVNRAASNLCQCPCNVHVQ